MDITISRDDTLDAIEWLSRGAIEAKRVAANEFWQFAESVAVALVKRSRNSERPIFPREARHLVLVELNSELSECDIDILSRSDLNSYVK